MSHTVILYFITQSNNLFFLVKFMKISYALLMLTIHNVNPGILFGEIFMWSNERIIYYCQVINAVKKKKTRTRTRVLSIESPTF